MGTLNGNKTCNAAIRTYANKTKIITLINEKHSGDHPVIMRALTAAAAATSSPSAAASSAFSSTPTSQSTFDSPLLSQTLFRMITYSGEFNVTSVNVDKIQELTLQLEDRNQRKPCASRQEPLTTDIASQTDKEEMVDNYLIWKKIFFLSNSYSVIDDIKELEISGNAKKIVDTNKLSSVKGNKPTEESMIHIFGDSHAKGLSATLQNKVTNDQLIGCANPGARLEYKNFIKSDVIIIAGNNDVGNFERGRRQSQLKHHLKSAPCKSHIVGNLFHRHEVPYSSYRNRTINQLYQDGTITVDICKLGKRTFTGARATPQQCRQSKFLLPKESEDVDTMNPQPTYSSAGNYEGFPLSTVTPESSPVTLPFDSYADTVSSTPGRASISNQQHQLQQSRVLTTTTEDGNSDTRVESRHLAV
ncbi:hypothetical protein J6590_068263 [Homalodisca vitripennis]|nr:hypothetical protein J6590_068263 [Homalodisca vitripennis]